MLGLFCSGRIALYSFGAKFKRVGNVSDKYELWFSTTFVYIQLNLNKCGATVLSTGVQAVSRPTLTKLPDRIPRVLATISTD